MSRPEMPSQVLLEGARKSTAVVETLVSTPQAGSQEEPEQQKVRLTLFKEQGRKLGATMLSSDMSREFVGAVMIMKISEGGLLHEWNESHPSEAIAAGDVVEEVNGETEASAIFHKLSQVGPISMVVRRSETGRGLQFEEASGSSDIAEQRGRRLVVKGGCCGGMAGKELKMKLLPVIRAGDAGVDQCSICMESVDAEENVAKLACGHAYHQSCLTKWMRKRPVCPLCIRDVE